MNSYKNIKVHKKVIAFVCCLLIFCCVCLTGCVLKSQNANLADVNATFEDDYSLLKQITDYLQSFSETNDIDSIWIKSNDYPVMIIHYTYSEHYGDRLQIQDEDFKEDVKTLFMRGYMDIDFEKSDITTISFDRFKKPFDVEYRSGFAYTTSTEGEIDVEYMISQKELSVAGWYYYEDDYNEWRSRNSRPNTLY